MKKFIYCEEEHKNRLLKEGLKFICNQTLANKEYCVFENNEIKNVHFDDVTLITSDKMFF